MKSFLIALVVLTIASCGGGGQENLFVEPGLVVVDSTNDRLFVIERDGILISLNASEQDSVGGAQPSVNEDRQASISAALPSSPTHAAVMDVSGTTRLFIAGAQLADDGSRPLNRILVLDFDGTTFSETSFSPITVEDADAGTNDTDNILGGLLVDAANSRLYVTDSTAGQLYVYNTSTGAQAAGSVAITGNPNRLALADGRLYVANSTATVANQAITVVNTADLSTTAIDLDLPFDDLSVISNNSGTVLMAKVARSQRVLVRTVDTGTFAASTAIPAGDSTVTAGEVNASFGISSAIGKIRLTKDSNGVIYGYIPLADGDIRRLTVLADLSSFTATTISTLSSVLSSTDVYTTGNNVGTTVFITADSSGELVFTDVGTTTVGTRF